MRRPPDPTRWRWRLPASGPRLLAGLLGAVCTAIGLIIVVRPLIALDTLTLTVGIALIASGLADLAVIGRAEGRNVAGTQLSRTTEQPGGGAADQAANGPRWPTLAVALGWVILGVIVLAWRGLSLAALVWVVGIALAAAGLVRIAHAVRTPQPGRERAANALLGVASLIVGVLALAWPDITVLVVAVTFGARTLWFGLVHLWTALRPLAATAVARDDDQSPASIAPSPERSSPASPSPLSHSHRRRTRRPSLIVAVVAVLAAVAAAGVSAAIHSGRPVVDAFYTSPATLPAGPGALIRSEPFTRDVPAGATGWRILYTTTGELGEPRTASALVVVPADSKPHPVIAWTHGTTGYAPPCAPSLARQPFASGAMFVLDQVIDRGWALVATDYAGLGTPGPQPYLIGKGEARSELDAVRAARQLSGTELADRTVVWGHSQGGHAALWVGQIARQYAPDVPLAGVAALAPASDLTAFAGLLTSITGGSVFASYVIAGYSQTYPDVSVRDDVRPSARVLVQRMSDRCLAEPGILVSVLSALSLSKDPAIWSQDPTTGPLGARLAENVPTGPFVAPVLIGQGAADTLIPPTLQRNYAQRLCDAGASVDYRSYPGRDHVSLVQPDSPLIGQLLSWTADRFAGRSARAGCASVGGE